MIAMSRQYALDAWWYPVFPGLALLVTTGRCVSTCSETH